MPSRRVAPAFAAAGLLGAVLCGRAGAADGLSPPSLRPPEVSDKVEAAIERGLGFLVSIQSPEGAYGANRDRYNVYPTVMSALVGLCFLAEGSTPTRGTHAVQIRKILDYLLANSVSEEGLLVNVDAREYRPMYGHAFAMSFLASVYGQEGDARRRQQIAEVLRAAVLLSRQVQSDEGGWGYQAKFSNHEGTLTVTQTQALRACRDAGIQVPKNVIDRSVSYIESSTNDNGSVRYHPWSRQTRHGVTCAAVVTLWNAGRYDDPLLRRITDYVERYITPRWNIKSSRQWDNEHHGEFVLYYLAQVKHIFGGKDWETFYRTIADRLLAAQEKDGSWGGTEDTVEYGEVYTTTMALLILQLPYNRLTLYQR